MCGRYTNTKGPEELNERLGMPISSPAGTHRFNIAPTEEVLAVVEHDGELQARMLRWGLLPHWSTDLKGAAKMINARMESVTSKPSFRDLVPKASHRALQIADGYFEWIKPERRGSRASRSSSRSTAASRSRSPRCGRPRGSAGS